jgi:hypothetical protein
MRMRSDVVISNIRIRIMRLLLLDIRIPQHVITIHIHVVIKCCYYPLSAYDVMSVLDYYLNLCAILNNAVIIIRKLK